MRSKHRAALRTTRKGKVHGERLTGSSKSWLLACMSVMFLGVVFRCWSLTLVPLHHDEGVNGYFLLQLFRAGQYHYDPANYHGPTLYYLTLIPVLINRVLFHTEGPSTIALRSVTVVFGVATLALVLSLRRYLGRAGSLIAALLLAVSPASTYFSRYYIHETLFVFFTLALLVSSIFFIHTGERKYIYFASASGALLFATKETAVISIIVLIVALMTTLLCRYFLWGERDGRLCSFTSGIESKVWVSLKVYSMQSACLFVLVYVGFYSSFGFNFPAGVTDSLRTYAFWTKTGVADNLHGFSTYLQWLQTEEFGIVVPASLGLMLAFRRKNFFSLFLGFWSIGIILAYSLIPYKTPWLILNMTLPLALLAGFGVSELRIGSRSTWEEMGLLTAFIFLLGATASISWHLNFSRYDDDSQPYVYSHTRRDFLALIRTIEDLGRVTGKGRQLSGSVTTPFYWPIPWYLREYPNVGYWNHVIETQTDFIVADPSQLQDLVKIEEGQYVEVGAYELRPGVRLVLLERQGLSYHSSMHRVKDTLYK